MENKEWHEEVKESIEKRLRLMRQVAMNKEMVDRLERMMAEREKQGIRFQYEELRMIFSTEELQLLADYKRHRLSELQEKLEQYTKTENESRKKMKKIHEMILKGERK